MPNSVLVPMAATGFRRLPEDTLRLIILHIYSPDATESKYWSPSGLDARISWLAASIPLSRAWASQGYPILYHTVPLDAHWRAVSFLSSITNRPLLAGFVRFLAMFPSREDPATAAVTEKRSWWRFDALRARARTKASRKFWQPYLDIRRLCSALTSMSIGPADYPLLEIHPRPQLLLVTSVADRLDLSGFAHLHTLLLVGTGSRSDLAVQLLAHEIHVDWNLQTLVLHDIAFELVDFVRFLSHVSSTLRTLTCHNVEVFDDRMCVPLSEWISPVQDSISTLSFAGCPTELRTLRMLRTVTSLSINITAWGKPQGRPEDYLPQNVEKLSLRIYASGRAIFLLRTRSMADGQGGSYSAAASASSCRRFHRVQPGGLAHLASTDLPHEGIRQTSRR